MKALRITRPVRASAIGAASIALGFAIGIVNAPGIADTVSRVGGDMQLPLERFATDHSSGDSAGIATHVAVTGCNTCGPSATASQPDPQGFDTTRLHPRDPRVHAHRLRANPVDRSAITDMKHWT
ncbi:hypothetical protein [Paraburkholderia sp.]|uniref:hypothetical protein n=1 Tax=Paraburkholderia sp. TaxID=1926495 RepID=UPI0023926534|nr:hypothetical protein [Paraburkholderia sp.]MDE1182151.1 hypothetical protein [Paraburkholderia sp.]